MASKDYISIKQLCIHYNIPISFIHSLNDLNLIEIKHIKSIQCISETQINDIEKMMRLHYDLDINLEGIDAIYNLIKKIESLNEHILELRNKLKRFNSY